MLLKSIPCLLSLLVSSCIGVKFAYPEVRRDESVVDDFYGIKVKDPYRWLEDDSDEVRQFVQAQNNLTDSYIDGEIRDKILKTLTQAFTYEKYTLPEKHGSRYFFFKNSGLQNQYVFYVQDSLGSEPRVLLDVNSLAADGTIAVTITEWSEDGELLAYGLSSKGSDWVTIRVKNITSGQDYPEILSEVKYSKVKWLHNNQGFFYARYPQANKSNDAGTETTKVSHHKLYYHRVGTEQTEDVLVVEFPDKPTYLIASHEVTKDGKFLLVFPQDGASTENFVYFANLEEALKKGIKGKLNLLPMMDKAIAQFTYVTSNEDSTVLFLTNHEKSPNMKIIGVDLNRPQERYWSLVVPENSKNVLQWAYPIHRDKMVLGYLEEVKTKLEVRFVGNGSFIQEIPLEIGTVSQASGKRDDHQFFFKFVSFLTPGSSYQVDFSKKPYKAVLYREAKAPGIEPSKFTTKQVFYKSKDGTRIPMFIIHKKNYIPQRNSPVYLYAYGGFGISTVPYFDPERIFFVQHFNGILAIPNIRGGGEYGTEWHEGGKLLNKQNGFDDFQSAAEYLINENYTISSKIFIIGGSNGGLLVGACMNQRPNLYGAAIAQVGVHDLLRFQKFTIGQAWCPEYGCSDDGNETHFENLYKLSPLHNVRFPKKENLQYPAVLLVTADHDDRVVPLHSYKLAAELQHSIGRSLRQTNPLMIKVQTKAGHGTGKPTTAKIAEHADIFAFLVKSLGYVFTL